MSICQERFTEGLLIYPQRGSIIIAIEAKIFMVEFLDHVSPQPVRILCRLEAGAFQRQAVECQACGAESGLFGLPSKRTNGKVVLLACFNL